MLSESLLAEYMRRFFGYGSWDARYWFVGMEEGGGSSLEEVARRLSAWDRRGKPELDDLYEFHRLSGITEWFGPNAKRQATWAQLCRIALVAGGSSADSRSIVEYQSSRLGRTSGETALLELLPLPSQKSSSWIYGETSLPILISRRAYEEHTRPRRLSQLKEKITAHQPVAVVFYGNREMWKTTLSLKRATNDFDRGELASTLLVAMAHPTAWDKASDRFAAVGELILARTNGPQ